MRPRLLFIYLTPASFVRDDLKLFDTLVDLKYCNFDADKARSFWGLIELWVRQFFWLIKEARHADAIFGWFADYHMIWPVILGRLFRKPVLVSLGGYDCIHLPNLEYGIYESRWRAPIARFVLRNATLLAPVSGSLLCTENTFSAWPEVSHNGLCAHVPRLKTPAHVIPTGYAPGDWPAGADVRGQTVCTVGLIDTERTLRRKGVDLVLETAAMLPDVQFHIIGISDDMGEWVRSTYAPGPNVEIRARVPREELVALYQAASVYLQLSRAEGMPNVLCEAMLCGCIPVVSDVFGNPDAAGPDGFVVPRPIPVEIASAIEAALQQEPAMRSRYREHIINHFQRRHREEKLRHAFEEVGVKL